MKRISESFDFDNPNVESLVDGIVDEYKVVRQFSELLEKYQTLESKDHKTSAYIDFTYDDEIEFVFEREPGIVYGYLLHGTTKEDIKDALKRFMVDRKVEKDKIILAIQKLLIDNSNLFESFDFEDDDTSIIDKRIEVYNPDNLYDMVADLVILDKKYKEISELTLNKDKFGNCDLYVQSKSTKGTPMYDEIPLDSNSKEDIVIGLKDYVNDFFLDDESKEEFIKVLRGIVLKHCSLLESFDFDSDDLGIEDFIENRIEVLNVGKLIDHTKDFIKLVNEARSKNLLNYSQVIGTTVFCGPDLQVLWTFSLTEKMIKLCPKNRGSKTKYSYAINVNAIPYLATAENKLAAFSKFSDIKHEWKPLSGDYNEIVELNELILYQTKLVQKALALLNQETYESIEKMIRLIAQRRISFVNYTNQYVSYRSGPYCVYDIPNPYGIERIDAPCFQASWCDVMLDVDPNLNSGEYLKKSLTYFNPFVLSRPEYKKTMDALEDCWKPEYWPS